MAIVDAHMHITDPARFDLAWTRSLPQPVDPTPAAYARACEGLGIGAAMIVETDVLPMQRMDEARFQSQAVRGGVFAGGVPCLDLREPDGERRIDELAALGGIRGIRWMCRDAEACRALGADARVRALLRHLGARGLAFDLHVPPHALGPCAEAIADAPGTRVVLNHCGHGDPVAFGARQGRAARHDRARWADGIAALARLPQVACKLSGVISHLAPGSWTAADLRPVLEHCLACFGPERCMFGSDWPVCTLGGSLAQWHAALAEVVRPLAEASQAAIFSGTARRWYGI